MATERKDETSAGSEKTLPWHATVEDGPYRSKKFDEMVRAVLDQMPPGAVLNHGEMAVIVLIDDFGIAPAEHAPCLCERPYAVHLGTTPVTPVGASCVLDGYCPRYRSVTADVMLEDLRAILRRTCRKKDQVVQELAAATEERDAVTRVLDAYDVNHDREPARAAPLHERVTRLARAAEDGEVASAAADATSAALEDAERERDEARTALGDHRTPSSLPVPMLLWCPACRERHIDRSNFATQVHKVHACQNCGNLFQPALVPTVGVQFLPGCKDDE